MGDIKRRIWSVDFLISTQPLRIPNHTAWICIWNCIFLSITYYYLWLCHVVFFRDEKHERQTSLKYDRLVHVVLSPTQGLEWSDRLTSVRIQFGTASWFNRGMPPSQCNALLMGWIFNPSHQNGRCHHLFDGNVIEMHCLHQHEGCRRQQDETKFETRGRILQVSS